MTTILATARRSALEVVSRDRLAEIPAQHNLNVEDRRTVAFHVDQMVRFRSLDFGELLRSLKRGALIPRRPRAAEPSHRERSSAQGQSRCWPSSLLR